MDPQRSTRRKKLKPTEIKNTTLAVAHSSKMPPPTIFKEPSRSPLKADIEFVSVSIELTNGK